MTKVLALASEDPSQFYLGDREVTVEERRSHRGGTHLRGRPTLHSSLHMLGPGRLITARAAP